MIDEERYMMTEEQAEAMVYSIILADNKEDYTPEFQKEVLFVIKRIREAL